MLAARHTASPRGALSSRAYPPLLYGDGQTPADWIDRSGAERREAGARVCKSVTERRRRRRRRFRQHSIARARTVGDTHRSAARVLEIDQLTD